MSEEKSPIPWILFLLLAISISFIIGHLYGRNELKKELVLAVFDVHTFEKEKINGACAPYKIKVKDAEVGIMSCALYK